MAKRIEGPFTNKWGNVIHPGDEVFSITTCTHTTHVCEGVYLGYLERPSYKWDPLQKKSVPTTVQNVQVRVKDTRMIYVYKDTKERVNWFRRDDKREVEWISQEYERISTLIYNQIVPRNISASQLASKI